MGKLSNAKRMLYLKIERARIALREEMNNNVITEADILKLIYKDSNYGIMSTQTKNRKESLLKDIFNCPFLLCDQPMLDITLKKMLPYFLSARYETEKEILTYQFKNGDISEEEYKVGLDELEFCFYKSSDDGKNILKTGHVCDVKSNITRTK